MTPEVLFKEAKSFFQVFEPKGEVITGVKVPGSVQLLGDVTEFNRGKVISANINKSAFIMAQKRKESDRSIFLYSRKYDEKIRLSLNEPQSTRENGWANYMSGALFMLEGTSKKVSGMNVFIDNNIPDLFHANNMEALEVGVAFIASKFGDWKIDSVQIAEVCSEAEKKFIGIESSPVKYIPILLGKNGAVTYFDLATGEHASIPVNLDKYSFMIMSSGVKKKSVEEKRSAIFAEVAASLEIMRKNGFNGETLDTLTMEQFDEFRGKLSMAQRKRCAYFISENDRVRAARESLKSGNAEMLIEAVNESQKNLKNRLEILEGENEILIDIIQDVEEVKAVRMLNMGTDGTVFMIVDKEKRNQAVTRIKKTFLGRTGFDLTAEIFDLTSELEEVNINVSEFRKSED